MHFAGGTQLGTSLICDMFKNAKFIIQGQAKPHCMVLLLWQFDVSALPQNVALIFRIEAVED